MNAPSEKAKLVIRPATNADISHITALNKKVYGSKASMTEDMVRGQIMHYPEGQFVAEYEGIIAGYCSTFRIKGNIGLKPHSWDEITGHGFASRHDPQGDYLYGMEVCVDAEYRQLRIGKRLYNQRKQLCKKLGLKGIIFGGRMPNYGKWYKKHQLPPERYVEQVKSKKVRDPILGFQLSNDFEVIGILEKYLPIDKDSRGFATHMVWNNPLIKNLEHIDSQGDVQRGRLPNTIRVSTVQYQMRKINGPDEFEKQVEYFIDIASDYKADFVTFPELFTLQLLSAAQTRIMRPEEAVSSISSYTDRFVKFMQNMAMSYNINIIGGSHPTIIEDGSLRNICYVFLRDGAVYQQQKIHTTPNEKHWWNMTGGDEVDVIPTDCGPIGVMICYDAEFPEMARHLVNQGAMMLFVPFCTDEKQGYLRVRYCCQARAVENQCYVVMSGVVGNLPDVENMDIHYAESCILTPCDFPCSRDGIAATTAPNTEMIAFADLRIENIMICRNSGTVQNLRDRRFELYGVHWKEGKKS